MIEEGQEQYTGPSLRLAYEQLKGTAEEQMSHGSDIDSKAAAMFAVATALVVRNL